MADPKHTCIDPSEQKDDSQQPADTPDMASPISIYHPASLYSFTSRDIFNHDADAWPSSSSSSLWPTGHEPWQPMITTTSSAFESSLGYDTSLPFPDPYLPEVTISEIDDGYYGNSPPPTSEHSGTARSPSSTTSSGLPVGQYSVSSRIVTKEDIQSGQSTHLSEDQIAADAAQTLFYEMPFRQCPSIANLVDELRIELRESPSFLNHIIDPYSLPISWPGRLYQTHTDAIPADNKHSKPASRNARKSSTTRSKRSKRTMRDCRGRTKRCQRTCRKYRRIGRVVY